jgi:hypothetical protein
MNLAEESEMNPHPTRDPELLKATAFAPTDWGAFEWDADHNADILTVSNGGRTIEWGPRKPEYLGKHYPPAWVPASTHAHLHSGRFRWDFVIDELAGAQLGIGFMLLWDIGPDWGFFGYLGSSTTAWSYDPSTGDVVYNTASIQDELPKSRDGHSGVVSLRLELPRDSAGTAWFSMQGTESRLIALPEGSVVLPEACFLRESQKVSLAAFRTE